MKNVLFVAAAGLAVTASAEVLYDADFSQAVGIDHDTIGNALEASGQFGANFVLSYPSPPASDTTRNFFETTGTSLISSDFGGDHRFESFDIDVSLVNEVDIDFVAGFVGMDSFNNSPTEFIEFFYTLDGGSDQPWFSFTDDPNGPNLNASLAGLDVSGASTLTVGINANANGGGDGWELFSATVEGEVIPAPASVAVLGLAGFAATRRR
ncbi:MAG: hypothetical protein AAF108_07795 [Planctomycetota bacterium]